MLDLASQLTTSFNNTAVKLTKKGTDTKIPGYYDSLLLLKYLFTWLCWVFIAVCRNFDVACGIFSCVKQDFSSLTRNRT